MVVGPAVAPTIPWTRREHDLLRADLATFGSKLMECEKTENRKNQYFKEFNKMKLFKANLFI